ncbi:hypothetical protein [Paraglaciecola sp.]|uniref:hypothetical protein n=1 Tax=Paraglaciecola sp. TaxID=1920173 RepID=UPI0030F38B41
MKILIATLLFLSIAISHAGTTFGLKSYKCTQTQSTGFIFINNQWSPTSFSTIDYILRPLGTTQFEYGLYKTEIDEFPSICEWNDANKREILSCMHEDIGGLNNFIFSVSSKKFVHSSTASYINHDNKTPNSIFIEIGACNITE